MTDYEAVFNDIMSYAKKNIGDPRVSNKEELEDYIKESDRKGAISGKLRRELLETRGANRLLEESSIKEKAIQKELSRPQRQRAADERKTAKTVKEINKKAYDSWKKNPGRFDLKGIDTKTHSYIRAEIRRKVKKNLNKGYKLERKGLQFYRLENDGKRARDIITGRFVKLQ